MATTDYKGVRLETVRIFFRYLPLILSVVILATGIAIITSITQDDYYDGYVQLMITPKSDHVELVRASRYKTTISSRELMHTESEVIKSWPLVQLAASSADPGWEEVFNSDPIEGSRLVRLMQSQLRVTPIRNSTMLKIGFTDSDPQRLARFLNLLSEHYKAARTQIAADTSSIRYYTEKIGHLNGLLDSLQQRRTEVLTENNLVDPIVEMPTHLRRSDQIDADNLALDRKIDEKATLVVQIETALNNFNNRDVLIMSFPANGSLVTLKNLYYQKQRELNLLQQKYQEDYFEISRMREEIELVKNQIVSEVSGLHDAETIQMQNLLAQRQRNSIIHRQLETVLEAYPRIVTILEQINLEIESNKKMLGVLTDKLSEYQLANPSFDADVNVAIVEPAFAPDSPSGPHRLLSILITLVLSLVISLLLAFLMDLLSNRYNSTYQLVMDLDLPVIISIPELQE
jgi:polysaccharide biosynthesis transport protein